MATFQPLNFNFGLDASLNDSLGGYGSAVPSMVPQATALQTPASAPGTLFSNLFGNGGGAQAGGGGLFSGQSMFGGFDASTGMRSNGWVPGALGIGQALLGAFQGRQAMSLAQDQFKEARRQFDLNFNAQRQTINTQLEDRQRARVAAGAPGAYEGVDSYLARNKV